MEAAGAGPVRGLAFMHVGGTVPDLEAAITEHEHLGVGPWAVSEPLDLSTYDGEAQEIAPQPVRIAYGRMPGGGAIELIEPGATDRPSPQRRLLLERPGISHMAYWCASVPEVLPRLLRSGATVFTIAVGDRTSAQEALDRGGERALVDTARACYVRLASTTIIELVDASMFGAPLETLLGAGITAIVPRPGGDGG